MVVDDLEALDLGEPERRHLGASLRLRDGEQVSATDGRGGWRMCRFTSSAGRGTLIADGETEQWDRPLPQLCVGFAPVKGDRPEWAVQKLTELGVDRIVLIRTERSVVRWEGDRVRSHLRRLDEVARQAVMQSRSLWLPSIEGVIPFEDAAAIPGASIAEPGGVPVSLGSPTVLVGPEGGWSGAERAAAGGRQVNLGAGILRTETAAVATGVLLAALRAGVVAGR